jgi:hypothetical protein
MADGRHSIPAWVPAAFHVAESHVAESLRDSAASCGATRPQRGAHNALTRRVLTQGRTGRRALPQAAASRRALTLLETLLALGLCGMILAAVSTATSLYWKYRSITREQVQSSQLLRGLAEDLTADLRGVLVPLRHLPDPTRAATGSGPETAVVFDHAESVDAQTGLPVALNLSPLYLSGTETTLALLTDRENDRFGGTGAEYRQATLQHVVWWVHDGSKQRVALAIRGTQTEFGNLVFPELAAGLARATRDFRDVTGSLVVPTDRVLLVSGQIRELRFRYSDGARWETTWNSHEKGSLPKLIEVSVTPASDVHQRTTMVMSLPQGGMP